MSGFLYLPPFVFRASTLRCPSSSGVYGCLPFDFSWLCLPASALWHPPAPSSVVAVVAYTFFVPSGVSHRLTIFLSCTLTPSVLIPVSEPSPFLPDFVLPPARDITQCLPPYRPLFYLELSWTLPMGSLKESEQLFLVRNMSDHPPRTPFTPAYTPELSRDANGNLLYRDAQGRRLPYNGPLPSQQQAMPEHSAQPIGHAPLNDRSRGGPSSPIEHAFAPQPEYQFTLRPVQSGTPQASIPIDPALLALPGGADLDLRDGPTIANAIGLKHAEKVAGSRRKGKERADPKGKKRQRASSGSENDSEPVAKRGHPQGSANYSKEDVRKMFDLIAELLPVGQKGWKEIERRYNKWAKHNGRAERPPKALENKYKQYLRQKKPTGSASCPPEVKRVHEIEDLINQRVGTRELSDSEFEDRSDNGSSDNDIVVVERTAIARRAPTPPLPRKSRARGTDLANKLANAFDPEVQKDCDDARARHSFENTQILTLSQ
ncbi:hypothetical protein B0H12DRAFT_1244114 [Mycena haematopus]|nr:hypothetical protein B0H12DRAFT_1244114 [Mycena haematopus]